MGVERMRVTIFNLLFRKEFYSYLWNFQISKTVITLSLCAIVILSFLVGSTNWNYLVKLTLCNALVVLHLLVLKLYGYDERKLIKKLNGG